MFFAHWSRDETTYRDMEKVNAFCGQCNSEQLHTFRMYEKKTKHYSVVSFGTHRQVSAICHGCLAEFGIEKDEEKKLIKRFVIELRGQEAFELIDKEKYDKAVKKFNENLGEDPDDIRSRYGLAKCHIAQGEYDKADANIRLLETKLPDNKDVIELRSLLNANRP